MIKGLVSDVFARFISYFLVKYGENSNHGEIIKYKKEGRSIPSDLPFFQRCHNGGEHVSNQN